MRRRVPGVGRAGQNGVENEHGVIRDPRAIAAATTTFGRYGAAPASDTPVAGTRRPELRSQQVSSFVRWALADLALALKEIERRLVLSSDETRMAGGCNGRLAASN